MKKSHREVGLIAVLLILFSLPIWTVVYPPLSDYPSHLLSIFIASEYHNPAFNFPDYFVVNWRPLPNVGSEVVIFLLAKVLPIETAGKIYLTAFGILFVLSIFYFVNAVDRRNGVLGFFGFLFFYNWYFHQGYINFYGSLPFYFFALGFWYHSPSLATLREKAGLSSLLVAIFFFHLFSWLALVGSIIFLMLWNVDNRKKLTNTGVALLPSLLLVVNYFIFLGGRSSTHTGAEFLNPYENITSAITHTFVDFSRWDLLIYVVPLGVLGFLLAKDHIFERARQDRQSRMLSWLAFCLVVMFFALPLQISGVWPFNLRLNLFIVFLAFASLSARSVGQFKKPLFATALIFSLVSLGNVWWHYREMSAQIETYVSGRDYTEPNKNILPLTVDISGGWKHIPLSTVWAYYHIAKGGAGPYLFDLPHGQIVNYRRPKREMFPAPSLYPHRVEDYNSQAHSGPYDYVLLWGTNAKIEREVARDFQSVFKNGQLTVYKKRLL